ncbi:MAG: 4-hydroxybutyrate--acetyl-CoA CoA transferase, partial [Defluviitaleaceae bacterium]|nr:4-hydroxybutyrate--acetyl-CoA CoA transferase [Defluviitaleaceae bacterium]
SGDIITAGMAAGEPVEFLMNLHRIAGRVKDVTVTNCLPTVMGEYLTNFEKYLDSFKIDSWFFSPMLRKYQPTGRVSFIPNNLHFAGSKRNAAVHTNVFAGLGSMPRGDGRIYLSGSNVYECMTAKLADTVILEISPNVPFVQGDCYLEWDDVDYIIESDNFPTTIPEAEPDGKDNIIGRYIAELINDGDCIQVGIGGIPNAVCACLAHKKDLGVHTEMMTTGIMRLMRCGAVNNSKKQVNPGKSVFCFALGSLELYKFMDGNPHVFCGDGAWVNDPYFIAKNDNQISINTTIEIDLTGQCCSESIGYKQFSGTGGQSDTATGAQKSKNGRSVIALYSTAMVRDPETGGREEISKIVPLLKPGAAVSLSRNDVDYVVTEYGMVRLKGLSVAERARLLISVAHPRFREELLKAAREFGYVG